MQKVAFETLGCKLNFSETSTIKRNFSESGYSIVDFSSKADIYVINTCSVTQNANSTCRKTVRRALTQNPEAFVAVIGCYSQLQPDDIAKIDGVDVVLGTKDKFRILDLFDDFVKQEKTIIYNTDVNEAADFHHSFSSDDRTRAFLKIQDGCDYKCSFCTIPLARGRSRSPEMDTVIRNAEFLVSEGFKEIVITGVNAGDFGTGRDENFYKLLYFLEKVEGLQRIRISSIEPNLLSEDIIRLTADSEVIQPHFHIPLQSGSDTMLKLMRRRYNSALYRQRVEMIKKRIPDACIGADVITGHPGETDQLFDKSFKFIDSLDVSYLHVFTYSERPDTHALKLKPVVDHKKRKERTHKLRRLSAKKRFAFDTQFINSIRPVLFESENKNGYIQGWTDNYIRIKFPYDFSLENKIIPVKVGERFKDGAHCAEIIQKEEKVNLELVIDELTEQ
ncbi:MAG: tRNA (N(6)-L-threonylcarbamoyladenosine(37)-C(2))-methylthiotransferase MtaB [Balneolaceae bacterium]